MIFDKAEFRANVKEAISMLDGKTPRTPEAKKLMEEDFELYQKCEKVLKQDVANNRVMLGVGNPPLGTFDVNSCDIDSQIAFKEYLSALTLLGLMVEIRNQV